MNEKAFEKFGLGLENRGLQRGAAERQRLAKSIWQNTGMSRFYFDDPNEARLARVYQARRGV